MATLAGLARALKGKSMNIEIKKHYASLSEAIRAGAALRPQAFQPGIRSSSCAIEAGVEAITGVAFADYNLIEDMYQYTADVRVLCPMGGCRFYGQYPAPLLTLCWHLNDYHKFTREQTADWLESEEEKLGFITLFEEAKESAQELVTV